MRTIAVLLLVLVGCAAEVDTAGPGTGGAGGDPATAGTTGAGGSAGTSGAGGTLAKSCSIPIEQISGQDNFAIWDQLRSDCTVRRNEPVRAVVVDGATDVFGAWPEVVSYSISEHTFGGAFDGQCNVDIRYGRPSSACASRNESLFVHLVVPAI